MKAKKRRSTLKTNPSSSSLAWLLTGFLVGAATVGWITINKDISLSDIIPVKSHPKLNASLQSPAPMPTETKPKQPKFDFYTVLTENETIVSPSQDGSTPQSKPLETNAKTESIPADAASSSETETVTPPPLPKAHYVLQVASFKTLSDADELKARLALKGIQVTIQSVKLKNGETWHRVRTQPFDSLQAAEIQKEKFQQQNIRSLILKLDN